MNNPWEEIKIPSQDLLYRLIDPEHPLRLLRARDTYGRFLFIYEFSLSDSTPDKFPELNGIDIYLRKPEETASGNCMLLLILREKANWQIFLSLCNDIVASTKELNQSVQATQVILRRLKRWQEFLRKRHSELLSEKEIKGLIGELLFIKRHIAPAFGMGAAIRFWQGPENSPQDFNINSSAVEVKCQLGTTEPRVHISSAEQLCSQLPELLLYVITLGKSQKEAEGAINLLWLAAEIRAALEIESPSEFERFNNLLYQTGYIDLEEYEEFSYLFVSEKMFLVHDDFPRICPETLPHGIERLNYDITLLDCESFATTPDWMKIV
ncbi:PD-(D/E)XK motif protein [Candidatus Venteria ishoeyi]|uniref:PD-(D/E)XK motif protein n=1 Tax=Candidatus Venteria ishoeyi TaxID=1899563 RepID=A0A1H6F491_9GAMM|nr:PD-(D/E)XK motif protein [Candidatus Venteria ishoeyi]SEH04940.1 Uncharacterised protein [Candidatus Venteria ishoeyi]